jgi:hypothetical protein
LTWQRQNADLAKITAALAPVNALDRVLVLIALRAEARLTQA